MGYTFRFFFPCTKEKEIERAPKITSSFGSALSQKNIAVTETTRRTQRPTRELGGGGWAMAQVVVLKDKMKYKERA